LEDGGSVPGGGPQESFVAAAAVVVVEDPPMHEGVGELQGPGGMGAAVEMGPLARDRTQRAGPAAAALDLMPLADQDFDLVGQGEEAGVEIAGDPVRAGLGDAVGRLGGVVAGRVAEQDDLGAVVLAAQKPGLVVLSQGAPVVGAAVAPALRLKAPAAVGVAPEAHLRASALVPGAVLEAVGVAWDGGDLGADAEVASACLLAAAGGEVVDEVAHLLGCHAKAGVGDGELSLPPVGLLDALPVEVPDDAAGSALADRGDGFHGVDGQLAQPLQVRAFGAQLVH
jgi:hypothetical protein